MFAVFRECAVKDAVCICVRGRQCEGGNVCVCVYVREAVCVYAVEFSLCVFCSWLCCMRVPAVVFDVCACVAAALCIVLCVLCYVHCDV